MPVWMDIVKNQLAKGQKDDPNYDLKDAMIDSKKIYKKSAKTVSAVAKKMVPVIGKNKTAKKPKRRRRRNTAKRNQ